MVSLFSTLRQELQGAGFAARSKEARDWFVERVKELNGRINRNKLLKDSEVKQQNTPKWGYMYMFLYDAKHKETLPYYDRFPLVIMLSPAPGGFLGLNLHYLHPRIRALFLDQLLATISDDKLTEGTRLKLRYQLLARARKFRYFQPCLKHYLFEQMKSRPAQIMAPDWETAIFLPTESFKGAQKTVVWKESKQIYQKA
jgi:hypothetical protein